MRCVVRICASFLLLFTALAGAARAGEDNAAGQAAGTRYRALIVCQTYAGTEKYLEGAAADRDAMKACLGQLDATPYEIRACSDLSAAGILEAVADCFAEADGDDVSLFYYNGHGAADGSFVGADAYFSRLSPQALRTALDRVPGRKVVVVDACYSGKIIEAGNAPAGQPPETEGAGGPETYVDAFRDDFREERDRSGDERYFILTAAQGRQPSYEIPIRFGSAEKVMGIFTYMFCRGCGWNGVTGSPCGMLADTGGDGAVSVREAFAWTLRIRKSYPDIPQEAGVWPEDCGWFEPFRRRGGP